MRTSGASLVSSVQDTICSRQDLSRRISRCLFLSHTPASAVTYTELPPVTHYVASAPTDTHAARSPAIQYVAPIPVVTYAAPSSEIDNVAPAPVVSCAAPATVIERSAL